MDSTQKFLKVVKTQKKERNSVDSIAVYLTLTCMYTRGYVVHVLITHW